MSVHCLLGWSGISSFLFRTKSQIFDHKIWPFDTNQHRPLIWIFFELRGSISSSRNCLKLKSIRFHPKFSNNFIRILYKESMFWLSFPTGNLPTFSLQSATANITFSQESYWCNSILRSPFSFKHSRGRAFHYFEALKAFFFLCTAAKCVVLNNVWKRVCENKYLTTLQKMFVL